jgi:DNA-binding PucR family transcriptional regulator
MRQAAVALHVHHSTLQERLTWLEGRLGFPPLGGPGRERLALALSLWRIARSDAG